LSRAQDMVFQEQVEHLANIWAYKASCQGIHPVLNTISYTFNDKV
jgi:hypothetical protein